MAKGTHRAKRVSARWRSLSLIVIGMLVGALLITPAGAHVTDSLSHLIKHLKKTFYTKAQIDQRATGCRGNIPADKMVKAGSVCIDRYEASVWSHPNGGVQYGVSSDDYPCADNGQNCRGKIFARSVPGVTPSRFITWFQAQAALANSGKRLPTNAEWQMAAQGTPNAGATPGAQDCATQPPGPSATGSRPNCTSAWGVRDMVGNVWEWVADWGPRSTGCGSWPAGYGTDYQCLTGAATTLAPGALIRGSSWNDGAAAGEFSISGFNAPSHSVNDIGFRGVR